MAGGGAQPRGRARPARCARANRRLVPRTPDAAEIGLDDLAEIATEVADLQHLGGAAAVEHARPTRRFALWSGRGRPLPSSTSRCRRHVFGDVGEAPATDCASWVPSTRSPASNVKSTLSVSSTSLSCAAGVGDAFSAASALASRRSCPRATITKRPLMTMPAPRTAERLVGDREGALLGGGLVGDVLLGERGRHRLHLEAIGEEIDDRRASADERGVTERLRLADLRRDDDDRLALAPLRTGHGVVVARLDGDLDRRVGLLEEGIARAEAS